MRVAALLAYHSAEDARSPSRSHGARARVNASGCGNPNSDPSAAWNHRSGTPACADSSARRPLVYGSAVGQPVGTQRGATHLRAWGEPDSEPPSARRRGANRCRGSQAKPAVDVGIDHRDAADVASTVAPTVAPDVARPSTPLLSHDQDTRGVGAPPPAPDWPGHGSRGALAAHRTGGASFAHQHRPAIHPALDERRPSHLNRVAASTAVMVAAWAGAWSAPWRDRSLGRRATTRSLVWKVQPAAVMSASALLAGVCRC